jgi:hypothetical protein
MTRDYRDFKINVARINRAEYGDGFLALFYIQKTNGMKSNVQMYETYEKGLKVTNVLDKVKEIIDMLYYYGQKEVVKKAKICCICGKEFTEWGNNPWPIKEEGTCCDTCNRDFVIPARIERMYDK